MTENTLLSLAGIIIIGTAAQWLAMRLHLPSILFLLIFGFLAGPVFGFIRPDELFGDLLFPIISLSVAVILFEGGMDLKLSELKDIGKSVRNLITVGVLTTWVLVSLTAYFVLNLKLPIAILFGAILVVTGPTVIGPLLRHVRPAGRVRSIVKWEGIMNDPIGVLLAILVFEVILVGNFSQARELVILGILKTIFLSSAVGIASAYVLTFCLKRYWIPDALHQVVTLMFIFGTFIAANALQVESGLLAVTLMGIIIANQKQVSVKHILEFKENLRVLIISILFIILSARLELNDLRIFDVRTWAFLGILIVVIRPLSVYLSSLGTGLNWKEKVFISWMAPRGIVAAAMASIFAYELSHTSHSQGTMLVPLTFAVIIVTVGFYGLTASPVAHLLGISTTNPQGILMVGAHPWGRQIAKKLKSSGIDVLLVDSNKKNVRLARKQGLKAFHENILQEDIDDKLSLDNVGKIFCLTSNDEANSLATLHFQDVLGLANVFQLNPESEEDTVLDANTPKHLRGRFLFKKGLNYKWLDNHFRSGATLEEMNVTDEFDLDEFLQKNQQNRQGIIPFFVINANNDLMVYNVEEPPEPKAGDRLIYLSYRLADDE